MSRTTVQCQGQKMSRTKFQCQGQKISRTKLQFQGQKMSRILQINVKVTRIKCKTIHEQHYRNNYMYHIHNYMKNILVMKVIIYSLTFNTFNDSFTVIPFPNNTAPSVVILLFL